MAGPVIGYVGMTHLGLVSAAAAAAKGFSVVGLDPDKALIEALRAGDWPVSEPRLDDLIREHEDRVAFSTDPTKLRACDLIYVAPDVATDEGGRSDLAGVDRLFDSTLEFAADETPIVILSQVPPGYTRRRAPDGRAVYYQVETLVFGQAVARALEPERFIVGAPSAETVLPASYRSFLDSFDCPQLVMRYESAELAKIAINCFLAASISTANTLAELCERIGADWSEIMPALRLDARIGPHAYITPGLGVAGGNLERDLASVRRMTEAHGTDGGVVLSWTENSAYRKDWPYRVLQDAILRDNPSARIAILGLAYKENTNSTRNAPSLALIARLSRAKITVYDPVVREGVPSRVTVAADALTAVRGADAVAITTPWDAFRELAPVDLATAMRGRLIVDPFRVLDGSAVTAAGLDYRALGVPEL